MPKPSLSFRTLAGLSERQLSALKKRRPLSSQGKKGNPYLFSYHFMKSGSSGGVQKWAMEQSTIPPHFYQEIISVCAPPRATWAGILTGEFNQSYGVLRETSPGFSTDP
jgi:hypothetical protein